MPLSYRALVWPIPVRGYGHQHWLRYPDLVEVPWLVTDLSNHIEVIANAPQAVEFDNTGLASTSPNSK